MRALAFILSVVVLSGTARADDWRQFRGNDSSGVSTEPNLPCKLDEADTLKWKTPLPGRGLSGPVVVGDRVFLTASSGYRDDRLHVLCFSATTGEQLWDRQFKATGRTVCHESMCMATPQPCSDGERIYAYYSCNDVVCLDLEGNLDLVSGPGARLSQREQFAGHVFVAGRGRRHAGAATGYRERVVRRRVEMRSPERRCGNWTASDPPIYASPALFRSSANAAPQVVLHSKKSLLSIDPRTGN